MAAMPSTRSDTRPNPCGARGLRALAAVLIVAALATPWLVLAQPRSGEANRPPPGSSRVLVVPQATTPPVIDGDLGDAAWRGAAVADRFWISEQQRWPSEPTEVRVRADGTHLYFAFKVFDSRPQEIEALQTRRDGAFGFDDQVTIELDPYLTYRRTSTFSVNALGTQKDSFAGGRARQRTWKGNWKAAVARTDFGWAAEIAIPFDILEFEPGTETIGVNFLRYHHRHMQWSRWADVTVRGLNEEMGRLAGLQPRTADRERPWTFLPYLLLGHQVPDRSGQIRETLAEAGVDLRYRPRSNLTGVLSLRPDFSQVEEAVTSADFSYSEKYRADLRPFFQEGSAYFGDRPAGNRPSPTSMYFYSNRVPDFDAGLKAFGRANGDQFGTLLTRAPDGRTDFVAKAQRQFERTHELSAMLVASDRTDLRNGLAVLRGAGRAPSGLNYAFDAAATRTDPLPGDGSHVRGRLGWGRGFWSVGGALDRYSRNFYPANGLLADDLPDTHGRSLFAGYFRDRAEGPLREVRADLAWEQRETGDGLLQRRKLYAGGSVEWRGPQIRLGAAYDAGPYRPVGSDHGRWSDTLNDDEFWTLNADFNTRSSGLGYGASHAFGQLGGGDYRYSSAYLWLRPLDTLVFNLSAERIDNFGTSHQAVLTGTWEAAPRHTLAGRVIAASYGHAYRLAYTWRVRGNLDVFAVYDDAPGLLPQLSAKLLLSY
jgi:hypothetical protein